MDEGGFGAFNSAPAVASPRQGRRTIEMKKNVVLEIYLEKGAPKVRCKDPADCVGSVPDVWKENWVTWKPKDKGAIWTVTFTAKMGPFQGNRRLFHPDKVKGKINESAKAEEFDYCVSYQLPDGGPVYHSDPKIKVRDLDVSLTFTQILTSGHEELADRNRVLSEVQAEIQELHLELAQRLVALVPPPDAGQDQSA